MTGQIVDDLVDGSLQHQALPVTQHAAIYVQLCQCKPFDRHLIVISRQRPVLEELFCLVRSFVRIARQHALIEALFWCQCRLVAKQDSKEFQVLDVAAEHDETHGQRRR